MASEEEVSTTTGSAVEEERELTIPGETKKLDTREDGIPAFSTAIRGSSISDKSLRK